MGSWTLGTRFSFAKYEHAWLDSICVSAQMCSNALSQRHRQDELEPFMSETELWHCRNQLPRCGGRGWYSWPSRTAPSKHRDSPNDKPV